MFRFTFCFRFRLFSPWWLLAFPLFLTSAIKFSSFSSNEIGLLCFLSLALALSLLSKSMQTLKLSRKKESALLLLFLSLKVLEAMRFTAEMRGCLKCKISCRLTWRGGGTSFPQSQNFLDAEIIKFFYPWCSAARSSIDASNDIREGVSARNNICLYPKTKVLQKVTERREERREESWMRGQQTCPLYNTLTCEQ